MTTTPSPGHLDAAESASRPVSRRLMAAIAFAQFGLFVALLTPVIVSLTLRVNAVVGDGEGRAGALGLILGVGAFFALAANPFFGHLSDRTTSRMGMRRPWLAVGTVGGVAGLAIIGVAESVPMLLVGWCVTQTFFNCVLAVLVALLSDQVPLLQRGRVSGLMGVGQIVGVTVGAALADVFTGDPLLLMVGPAVVLLVAVPILMSVLPDRRLDPADRPPFSVRTAAATFVFNPRRNPDFGWAWLSRFLGFYGVATILSFQGLYLGTRLDVPDEDLAGTVFQFQMVQNPCIIAAALLAGFLSDRVGRRKLWVLGASLVQAAGLGTLAFAPNLPAVLAGAVITGLAMGVFVSVELALAVNVLPDPATAAKDLGVYNIANAAPQSVAPAVGPALIAAGGFGLLFLGSSAIAAAGGAAIMKIKGRK
ncbi:MAG: MFS transporter [Actinophytocola sp.]|nr:MFS transporter [Actinophytocola sp.]